MQTDTLKELADAVERLDGPSREIRPRERHHFGRAPRRRDMGEGNNTVAPTDYDTLRETVARAFIRPLGYPPDCDWERVWVGNIADDASTGSLKALCMNLATAALEASDIRHLQAKVERLEAALVEELVEQIEWVERKCANASYVPIKVDTAKRILTALRASTSEGEGFQQGVDRWMDACFGDAIKADQVERADRFIEEALELAQTMPGFGPERAHALVDYVFNRDVGERAQEVGGVMVTLAALCNTVGIDIADAGNTELARVWTKVEQIRAKQAAKPTGSALPVAPKDHSHD